MQKLHVPSTPRIVAIVPAAGIGSRAVAKSSPGQSLQAATRAAAPLPKQYRLIHGRPMLWWSVRALLQDERIREVVVGVGRQDPYVVAALEGLHRVRWLETGGPSRYATVRNTLQECGIDDDGWVLVHDAARPGLPGSALRALIDACLPDEVGGLLALPVADTLKHDMALQNGEANGPPARVARTVAREHLWQAQTPQMFRAGLLRRAFAEMDRLGLEPTDEAGSIENLGLQPLLVQGSLINFKVTWPQDFEWMEKWLQ